MRVRLATESDFDALVEGGKRFFAESNLPGTFNPEYFKAAVSTLTGLGAAFVLLLESDDGVILGALGAIVSPDMMTGEISGNEAFWFVHPEHRRGTGAIRLVKEFERECISRGAVRLVMVALDNFSGPSVSRVYEKRGYVRTESTFLKRPV